MFVLNFILALTSVLILQNAARDAKESAEATLEAKVLRLREKIEPDKATNNANRASELLEEIRNLHRGAFVPFWKNPVVGALFLSSGGTTALQVFILLMNR
jgi:hypothetical protein